MIKVLELFAGIGACSKAFERLGIEHEVVDVVEIDKYAVKSYNAIHGTNFEPQDITQWNKDIEVDFIMHGSPCQDFSLAGKQKGGEKDSGTRSSLLYETVRIVAKLKPKYVLWENVKNVVSKKHFHTFQNYLDEMEQLGYTNHWQVLNAKDYGIPQNRERVFCLSIMNDEENVIQMIRERQPSLTRYDFPPKQELKLRLKDMLEDAVDEKYYLTDLQQQMITPEGNIKRYINSNVVDEFEEGDCADISFPNGYNKANRVFKEQSPCINNTTVKSFIVKEATKKGYKEAYDGDGVYINRPHQKRGVVQPQMIQTIKTSGSDLGVVVDSIGIYNHDGSKNFTKGKRDLGYKESAPALRTQPRYSIYKNTDLRIRKLTPLECWRLMGFDDTDFEKAEQVNSNSQLYKQAGNSIVCNVLEAIIKEMKLDEQNRSSIN